MSLCWDLEIVSSRLWTWKKMFNLLFKLLARFPRSASQHTKFHMSLILVVVFIFHTLCVLMITNYIKKKRWGFEFLIFAYFRKEGWADLSSSQHVFLSCIHTFFLRSFFSHYSLLCFSSPTNSLCLFLLFFQFDIISVQNMCKNNI